MTLARTWTRQLGAASSVALIVPCAMVAALVALALGGGFGGLGVLGQVFAGPSIPNSGPLVAGGSGAHAATRTAGPAAIPVIPVVRVVARAPTRRRSAAAGPGAPGTARSSAGLGSTGATIAPGGATTRPVSGSSGSGSPRPPASPSPAPTSSTPSPSPSPAPQPSPVDTVVNTVTSVADQVPGPAGPVATQVVQAAGSAAANLLPGH